MQRNGIARRNVWGKRGKSGDQLGSGDEVQSSRGQRGHVQRLADMASGFRAIRMAVEDAAARREIQQHGARKYRQRPARICPSEYGPTTLHNPPR